MANREHWTILHAVNAWNTMRNENPDLVPDLRGARLVWADLSGANLSGADLSGADLRMTELQKADFTAANVQGAQMAGAVFRETIFNDVDMSEADNLHECKHLGPSCVDYRTLVRSSAAPLEFWRGCGLSDWQIEVAKLGRPGLTQADVTDIGYEAIRLRADQPIQLFSPFISYSSDDDQFAKRLYDGLQNSGVRCWYAPEDMKIGDRIRVRIDEVIHIHDKLLLILSEHSAASQWVEQEVETALAKERKTGTVVLFPIKIDRAVDSMRVGWPALIRNTRHIGDFTNWQLEGAFQAGLERVIQDLRAMP